MTVEFGPTLKEFTEAWLSATRRFRWLATVTCLIGGPLLAGVLHFLSEPNLSWLYIIAGWLLYMGLSLPWTARRRIKQFWLRHHFVTEPVKATFDTNGFSYETFSGTTHLHWHTFSHWCETPRLILLFRGPMMCLYLPKRAMQSNSEIAECRELLKQFIGRTKYSPPVRAFAVEPLSAAA